MKRSDASLSHIENYSIPIALATPSFASSSTTVRHKKHQSLKLFQDDFQSLQALYSVVPFLMRSAKPSPFLLVGQRAERKRSERFSVHASKSSGSTIKATKSMHRRLFFFEKETASDLDPEVGARSGGP